MKKKILALLMGGALAVSGLFMSAPAAVQAAEPCVNPRNHFNSWTLTPGNAQITIQWATNVPNHKGTGSLDYIGQNHVAFRLAEEEIKGAEDKTFGDFGTEGDDEENWAIWSAYYEGNASGSHTITGLTNGTTYYVYAEINVIYDAAENYVMYETEGSHTLLLMGHVTPDASLSNDPVTSSSGSASVVSGKVDEADSSTTFEEDLISQITETQPGSTIVMDKGVTTLSNSVMKELLKRKDVSLKLEFTYQDKEYVIIIPAGAALDNDIPYYGPLYLAQHFGNRAGTAGSEAGVTYEVKSGDTLSRIAAANNMTLKQLLAKNPQIKDPDKIAVGQKINR